MNRQPGLAAGPGRRRSGYGPGIGCLLFLLAFISPRLVLFLLWLFSDLLSRAFDKPVRPLPRLLPAALDDPRLRGDVEQASDGVFGFEWFIVVLAFCFDLGSYASRDRFRSARD